MPIALALLAGGCAGSPTATPAPTASAPSPASGPTTSGPIASLPAGCLEQANGSATQSRVSITDVATATYPDYDVLIFDFDRGLPDWTVSHVEPPFTRDPSGLPIEVDGSFFYSVVLSGASIVDEASQPVYEGPTELRPELPRIRHLVLAGDFEAVSTWLVGLEGPTCVAAQAFDDRRLVIAFLDAP